MLAIANIMDIIMNLPALIKVNGDTLLTVNLVGGRLNTEDIPCAIKAASTHGTSAA